MAAQSKPTTNEKKQGKKELKSVHREQLNFNQSDGLFEYLYRRYTKNRSLFSAEETAIYAAMTIKGFN